ncbi:MAG: HepT-like ribonuclease domain-containing protein [Candidatus Falkowbacteria bacterium]
MLKDNKIFLQHILESINLVQVHTKGVKQEDFIKSWPLIDASIRRIEIIGEAANKISSDFKIKHKEIPWRDIIGMRNVLIHEYFDVDEVEVWKTIKKDLPKLKKLISQALK